MSKWFAFPKSGKVMIGHSDAPVYDNGREIEPGLPLPDPGPTGYEEDMREPNGLDRWPAWNPSRNRFDADFTPGRASYEHFDGKRPIVRKAEPKCDTVPPVVGGLYKCRNGQTYKINTSCDPNLDCSSSDAHWLPNGIRVKGNGDRDPQWDIIARLDVPQPLKLGPESVGKWYETRGGWKAQYKGKISDISEANVAHWRGHRQVCEHKEDGTLKTRFSAYSCDDLKHEEFDLVREIPAQAGVSAITAGKVEPKLGHSALPSKDAACESPLAGFKSRDQGQPIPNQPGRELCSVCGTICGGESIANCGEMVRLFDKYPDLPGDSIFRIAKRNRVPPPFKLSEPEPVKSKGWPVKVEYRIKDNGKTVSDWRGSRSEFSIATSSELRKTALEIESEQATQKRLAHQAWLESLGRKT